MYYLLECSSNYSDLAGSLWFYSDEGEATNFNKNIANTDNISIKPNY